MSAVLALVYYYEEHMPLWQMSHDCIGLYLHLDEPTPEAVRTGRDVSLNDLFVPLGLSVRAVADAFGQEGVFVPSGASLDDAEWTSPFSLQWIYENPESAQILANLLKMPVMMFTLEQSSPAGTLPEASHKAVPVIA